jgi:hypothetical protein
MPPSIFESSVVGSPLAGRSVDVNGENRMEGLVCWSNYGGNGSLNTQKSEGLGRCLAGHKTP